MGNTTAMFQRQKLLKRQSWKLLQIPCSHYHRKRSFGYSKRNPGRTENSTIKASCTGHRRKRSVPKLSLTVEHTYGITSRDCTGSSPIITKAALPGAGTFPIYTVHYVRILSTSMSSMMNLMKTMEGSKLSSLITRSHFLVLASCYLSSLPRVPTSYRNLLL